MGVEYPNIQIITCDSDVMFWGDGVELYSADNIKRYRYRDYVKNYIPLNNSRSAVVMISNCIDNIDGAIIYLKEKNIDTVYFYIDDVFRLSLSPNMKYIQSYCEAKIINTIIEKCNLSKYYIYHCEKIKKNQTGLDLFDNTFYLDLFLLEFSQNPIFKKFDKIDDNFTKKISCLNNRYEHHRYLITTFLIDNKDVFLTFNDTDSIENIWERLLPVIDKFSDKNKEILLNNSFLVEPVFGEKKHFLTGEHQHTEEPLKMIKSGFVNIISETTFMVPYQYISEKSLKPMAVYRPFIMLGPSGNLSLLKEMGFKTFDNWWDESYDKETDHVKRIEMVYEVAKFILSKSYDEINRIYDEMESILIHNKKRIKKLPNYFLHNLQPHTKPKFI